jgi:hypothetical protein
MKAASLAQARLLAVVNGCGRASQFVEGYPIDAQLAARVPNHSVGRILTPAEGAAVAQDHKIWPAEVTQAAAALMFAPRLRQQAGRSGKGGPGAAPNYVFSLIDTPT